MFAQRSSNHFVGPVNTYVLKSCLGRILLLIGKFMGRKKMTDLKYLYIKFQNYLSGFGKSVYIS